MKRVPQSEILDDAELSSEEAVQSLRDLRHVNRFFGGIATTRFLLKHAMLTCGLKSASVLEVAAGDGYVITETANRLKSENLQVDATCLDKRELPLTSCCCENWIVGDALHLNFAPASFDFVSCGLFLHHLSAEQLITFVNGALRIAREGVLMNDLLRSRLHLALVYAWTPMFRSRVSRFDGPASVRQAYTDKELRVLLGQTGAKAIEMHRKYFCRIAAIAWK